MKERPILFSGLMVRAILEGRKTQTRRVITYRISGPNPPHRPGVYDWRDKRGHWAGAHSGNGVHGKEKDNALLLCPYGQPGDRLWVRETFIPYEHPSGYGVWFAADGRCREALYDQPDEYTFEFRGLGRDMVGVKEGLPEHEDVPKRPSIFMPRWASRITLEVTDIRVERLQDISEQDAIAEGIDISHEDHEWRGTEKSRGAHVGRFAFGWDKINGKRAPWSSNPWVWAISFKRIGE